MDRFMEQFYIQQTSAELLRRTAANELRSHKLATVIRKQMRAVFSLHTLGLFDKKFVLNGCDHTKLQIPAVTNTSMSLLLGREPNELLDKALIDNAWRIVYLHGLVPSMPVKH